MYSTFFIAFYYMKQETEEDYMWALGQLKNILQQSGFSSPGVMVTD